MTTTPLRAAPLLFAATEKLTVPLPEPLVPPVMVIQLFVLLAVQAHPLGAVTFTLYEPPPETAAAPLAESEYVQEAPPSVTMNVWPAMVTVPVSALELVLAATE
jgi:hypothetical protein